jgi:RNA polymerase sigma factor for flagellar operon FliA
VNGLAAYSSVQERSYDDLVTQYAPLVKRIAYHLMNRLPPSVQADDLIQAGMIGLLEASRNYDPTQGASFETYAGIRIRGSMLDEIRRSDWTPRSVHRKARQVAEAMREIENREGRDARDAEVAEVLGMDLEEYHQILQDASGCRIFSLDELASVGELGGGENGRGGMKGPYDGLQQDAFKQALAEAIAGLPERERLVIAMYYDDELNLREIGQVLGVSESRVCQIHSQAAMRLRARLEDWLHAETEDTLRLD